MFELSIDMGVGGLWSRLAPSDRSDTTRPSARFPCPFLPRSITPPTSISHHTNLREITPASHQSMLACRRADEQVTQGYDAMIVRQSKGLRKTQSIPNIPTYMDSNECSRVHSSLLRETRSAVRQHPSKRRTRSRR